MLAAAINKDHVGSGWTADIASKKFAYLQGKYGAAKTASYRSDWGLSQQELNKGISMTKKLDMLCKDFDVWDRWFGNTQKYAPSNVQDSSSTLEATSPSAAVRAETISDTTSASDSDVSEESDAHRGENIFGDDNDQTDINAFQDSNGLHGDLSAERAIQFTRDTAAPAMLSMHTQLPAAGAAVGGAAKPPTQAQVRKDKAKRPMKWPPQSRKLWMRLISSPPPSIRRPEALLIKRTLQPTKLKSPD